VALFGLALAILGLLLRRPVLVAGGAATMWVDRESVLHGLRGEDLLGGTREPRRVPSA
jgi:hypothetical protein